MAARQHLTDEAYDRMLAEQGGGCGICRSTLPFLCVNYYYHTGRVRALLCPPCNHALVRAAVAYLDSLRP